MCSRVVKWFFPLMLLCCSFSSVSLAVEVCGANAVDPDNDGWGWENGASCRVTIVDRPEPPMCTGVDSDPDGDGWGWENGASCRVGQQVGPGDSFETAGLVQMDGAISGTIVGVSQHYYRFEVTTSVGVKLDANFNFSGSLELYVSDGSIRLLDTYYYSDDPEGCLQPGTYYLVLDRRYIDTANSVDYTVSVSTNSLSCVEPQVEYDLPVPDLVKIDDSGNVYWYGWEYDAFDSALSKRDTTGAVL